MQSCHALNCKLYVQIFLTYQIIIHMLLTLKRKCLSKKGELSFRRYSFNKKNLQSRRYEEKLPA